MAYPAIFITGTDGSGKTTLTQWLKNHFEQNGIPVKTVWSRYNNYISKPFLAVTRMTGHNYYESCQNNLFGYHDFQELNFWNKVYVALQCIDVNIATYKNILRHLDRERHALICERGPWDTLADVILDTGQNDLLETNMGNRFIKNVRGKFQVVFVSRSYEKIVESRPGLVFDRSLKKKIEIYQRLASTFQWQLLDNDNDLDQTKKSLVNIISTQSEII